MSEITIKESEIKDIIEESDIEDIKMGVKTTVVMLTMKNGFVIIESSACVDPENYDHEIGIAMCIARIKDKIWMLEGYRLQNEVYLKSLEAN